MQLRETLDRWFGRTANIVQLLPAAVLGVVTGFLSSSVAWINQWGAYGWVMAGLVAFALTALGTALASFARHKWLMGSAARRWAKEVDQVNPLDKEFHKKRIDIAKLAHPLLKEIKNKRFTDCELIGPANIVISDNITLTGVTFHNCDFVPTKRRLRLYNAVKIADTEIFSGALISLTIYIHPDALPIFDASVHQPYYPTITGDPAIDAREPDPNGK